MSESFYPAQLDLNGKTCVVVGAGKVAQRKAEALVQCGAEVKLVAPGIPPELPALAHVQVVQREYRTGDLDEAWLVVAATDDPTANAAVARDAAAARIWVNVVDDPALSSFIVPAVVRRGSITIGVSTGGASPALAGAVRDIIEGAIDPAYGLFAELLAEHRPKVMAALPSRKERGAVLRHMASDEVLQCLRERGRQAASEMMGRMLDQALRPGRE